MNENKKIKRSDLEEIIRQNRTMRTLLESWPAREIMMDYEKSWDERRRIFLDENPPAEILSGES